MRVEIGNGRAVVGNYSELEKVVLAAVEEVVLNIEHLVGEAVEVVCKGEGVATAMYRQGEAENKQVAAAEGRRGE